MRELKPDGLFLSNGPGDPAAVGYALEHDPRAVRGRAPDVRHLPRTPAGGTGLRRRRPPRCPTVIEVETTRYGTCATDQVLITTQNHGFAVVGEQDGVPGAPALEVTHLNLNDGTIEGIRHRELPLFAVQYHPEAAPGPHDALPHFAEFMASLAVRRSVQSPKPLTDKG